MDAQLALPLADGSIDAVTRRPRAAAGLPRPPAGAGPRLGELLGALSHALDMGAGQPAGHALRSCWIGGQIGRALGLNAPQLRALHDATLLKDAGCSSNASAGSSSPTTSASSAIAGRPAWACPACCASSSPTPARGPAPPPAGAPCSTPCATAASCSAN
jgi:hypothetical protein